MDREVAAIKGLEEAQGELRLSDAKFCTELGISRNMWWMLRTRQRRLSDGVLMRAVRWAHRRRLRGLESELLGLIRFP